MDIVDAFRLNVTDEDDGGMDDRDEHHDAGFSDCHAVAAAPPADSPDVRRVKTAVSPFLYAFYQHHIMKILVDSGATSSLVSNSFAHKVGLRVESTKHGATQLDKSPLTVSGEVKFSVLFGDMNLESEWLGKCSA